MAGTVTQTSGTSGGEEPYLAAYTLALLSTAGGAVSDHPLTLATGQLVQIKVKPDAGGTQPTDQFDLTLVDADGIDLLSGAGANMSNSTGVLLVCDPPVYLLGTIDPVLANAGDSKGVTVTLVVKPY